MLVPVRRQRHGRDASKVWRGCRCTHSYMKCDAAGNDKELYGDEGKKGWTV